MKDSVFRMFCALENSAKRFANFVVSKIRQAEIGWVVAIFATFFLIVTLFIVIPKEKDYSMLLPLGFSEIEQIEMDTLKKGQTIDPLTAYYAKTNDLLMKVFECSNTSLNYKIIGSNYASFARELEFRNDKIYKYEFDLFDSVPKIADQALAQLKQWKDLSPILSNTQQSFNTVWKEDHDDVYRTEVHFSTDSDGNTVMKTDSVYDHTDHEYIYIRLTGEQSYKLGIQMVMKYPSILWPGNLIQPSTTNAEGEYAADKSRRKLVEGGKPEELLDIARLWNRGSVYMVNREKVLIYRNLPKLIKVWEKHKDTAKSESYRTNHRSDPGPEQYRTVQNILDDIQTVRTATGEVLSTISTTKQTLPQLKKKIDQFVAVVLDYKEGDKDELYNEIIDMAKNLYELNFPQGLNMRTFRRWLVFLWGLAAIVVGALLGWLVKSVVGDIPRRRYYY